MRLYHTSDRTIIEPDIHYGRKNADFGWGFYLTPDRDFTYRWAKAQAIVNEYELDTEGLDIHCFSRDTDWFRYIFHNRRAKDTLSSEVIIGPIANDIIFDTLGVFSSGFLGPEEALALLLIGPEYTQVAIKSERAVKQLHWIRSERIERTDEQTLQEEKAAYLEALSRRMEQVLGEG